MACIVQVSGDSNGRYGFSRRNELMQEMRNQFKPGYQEKCWEGDSIEDPSHDHK
jgi:hypothetical protein